MEEKKGFFAKLFGKSKGAQPAEPQTQAPAEEGQQPAEEQQTPEQQQ